MTFQAPVHFTVSQVRVAATCPRIFYFDHVKSVQNGASSSSPGKFVTRIWERSHLDSDVVSAAGTVFHNAVERFNRLAAGAADVRRAVSAETSPEIQQELQKYFNSECLNPQSLIDRPTETVIAFRDCVSRYMEELADIIVYARSHHSADEIVKQLFADNRKNVDVTFYVGPQEEPVHVTGRIDYVFYDFRRKNHRIIDYKLKPLDSPNKDLFQVATYALMHHHQHQTKPDVAVFYLHPERSIHELTWDEVYESRKLIYDLLASMLQWTRFVTEGGLHPPGDASFCGICPWDKNDYCLQHLGEKSSGQRYSGWTEDAESARPRDEPKVEVAEDNPVGDADDAPAYPNETRNEAGLLVGKFERSPAVVPLSAINTHIAVVGAAGSGKTYMAKIIAEEAIRNGVPVLAVDPQGDLVQFIRRADPHDLDSSLQDQYAEFSNRVEPRVFTPGSSHAQRISLSPLRLPTLSELGNIDRPDRREEELESMLSATANNLVNLADIGGESDSQRTLLFKIIRFLSNSAPQKNLELSDIVAALVDPEAAGIESPDQIVKKSEREKLYRKLNNFIEGPASTLFRGGQQLDLNELTAPGTSGRVPLNVVYLNALTSDQEKQFFVAMLASEIYRWMVTSLESSGRPNLLFYIDEARDFIPAGASKPPAKEPLIRLFTQGRKYGVGCLLCTQSPRSVDYNVFGNCSTKFIGRLEAAQDVDRIKEWFSTSGPVPAWIAERKGSTRGTFVARWPEQDKNNEGQLFKGRQLFSLHEGAWSPDRVESICHQ